LPCNTFIAIVFATQKPSDPTGIDAIEIAYSVNDVLIRHWLDYDDEADVLYVHSEEKPASTHSEMTDEGILLDYRDETLVGLTILDASQREEKG